MHWFYLVLAIVTEVMGTIALKYAQGFTNWLPSVGVMIFYVASAYSFSLAVEQIDLGVAYSIWSGVGIVAIVLIGYFLFDEILSAWKMFFVSVILIGAVGLYLVE